MEYLELTKDRKIYHEVKHEVAYGQMDIAMACCPKDHIQALYEALEDLCEEELV